ncbi:serine/threonine-protein kinase WNK4 [Carex littledalei]|uniref:non-specific serine/threonine protein kinase n=1 Tax=Carex littledalei TaxID=544730 RepID=A0A833R4U3_9POAL|nr:serine/threonine-protein kinase WNK4 [Carex littledalei]
MGKNGSSKVGSDADPDGVVETDPTQRYLRYSDVLGKGAYKKVYKAFDQIDGIEVAWNKVSIDQMLQSPENLSRLYSEVHFLKTLRHQNILRFHTSWVDDENRHINIITELFISGSLRSYRKMHQRVDLKAIKNWARQILRGLVFLHSHKPPIIHRDLKCDNIFINGNSGEVKIGDLGLATMMLQAKARSVLGTPEFMAPELYDEEYNELVDIYSFGMCMLEMVTLEYPYSECHNAAQIFKRVSSGVKPAALEKVTNLQLRYFIEQCLFPASERKSATELLEDPFLQCSTSQEINPFLQCSTSQEMNPNNTVTSVQSSQSHRSTSVEKFLLDVEAEGRSNPNSAGGVEANYTEPVPISDGGVEESHTEPVPPILEFVRVNEDIEFRLEGGTIDDNSVSLYMRITDSDGHVRNVHFTFYLDSDTSFGVAGEMVEQLELGDYHVPFLSEFIDYLIMCLVPDWKPLSEESANGDNASTMGNGSTLENELTMENESNRSDGLPDTNRLCLNSTLINALRAVCEEEVKSASDGSSTSVKPDSGGSPKSNSGGHTRSENCNCEAGESSAPHDRCHIVVEAVGKKPLNGCTLQCLDKDDEEGLQSEIYDIKEHYRHLFEELNRMQEVALTNARKRWTRKLDKRST